MKLHKHFLNQRLPFLFKVFFPNLFHFSFGQKLVLNNVASPTRQYYILDGVPHRTLFPVYGQPAASTYFSYLLPYIFRNVTVVTNFLSTFVPRNKNVLLYIKGLFSVKLYFSLQNFVYPLWTILKNNLSFMVSVSVNRTIRAGLLCYAFLTAIAQTIFRMPTRSFAKVSGGFVYSTAWADFIYNPIVP